MQENEQGRSLDDDEIVNQKAKLIPSIKHKPILSRNCENFSEQQNSRTIDVTPGARYT